jgi:hypothetical protein
MFYSKTAALAQHVGEITKILQEIYRDTDKKILDIELRNRAQCLILLGYTLRRRKTNKPFVPAEKSEWIQLYNNGACAMKDYCDMGMQVYVAKKCEDVKCLIVPGCAGGGGGGSGGGGSNKSGGGGGSNKSGGSDSLQDIKVKYNTASDLYNDYYNHDEIKLAFKNLEKEYNYLIDNCATKINSDCKVILLHFNESYKLILDIATILYYDNENDLRHYVIDLVNEINDYCAKELDYYQTQRPNLTINPKINNIFHFQKELLQLYSSFLETLRNENSLQKISILQDIAIDIVLIRKELKENKISPDA